MIHSDSQPQADPVKTANLAVRPWYDAGRIILIYLAMGMLWIFFSDKLIAWLFQDSARYQQAQLFKGWFFILLSGAVFYLIISKFLKVIEQSAQRIVQDNKRLHDLAFFDQLTLLPNRIMLDGQGSELLRRAEESGVRVYLCYLDVDNFKHINETMTHSAGDALLRHMANQLNSESNANIHAFRLGGDEFALILTETPGSATVPELLVPLKQRLEAPWDYQGTQFHFTVSIGVAVFPDQGHQMDDLCQNADAALAFVKGHGKNGVAIYSKDMQEVSWTYLKLFNGLETAIAADSFVLHFQPILDLKTRAVTSLEALIRWMDPLRGFVSPLEFIPFSESTGQIFAITEWVVRMVGSLLQTEVQQGGVPVPVTVNLSAVVLRNGSFRDMIERIERENGLANRYLRFEITETAAIQDFDQTVDTLQWLRERGYKVLLDDFGIGYSSLTYLQKLPIDVIKIDKSFIRDITTRTDHQLMFHSIISLAHHMGLEVVAEGIETQAQLDFVIESGCDQAQGYLLARPAPFSEITEMLLVTPAKPKARL